MLLFGAMYFVQGIAEPTEGLIAQPVRSLLKSWGYTATAIAGFSALLSIPWTLKPIYGLLTDFVPLAGTRRRSYLILTSAMTVAGLAYLYFFPPQRGEYTLLLALLLVPTVGVAFSDVVVDGLMVEKGQPRGLTGRLQSIQWASIYAASILTGVAGGYFSQRGEQNLAFLVCALATFFTFLQAWFFVREERGLSPALDGNPSAGVRSAVWRAARELWRTARSPAVLAAGAFLFLWNFNPFNSSVLYVHMTSELKMSEQFYGNTLALFAGGAVAGSLLYGLYCRRVRFAWLIHVSIAAGILSTLAYWGLAGRTSAVVISLVVGVTYMTGSLVQLDLAARACPLASAGTTFALLMSVSNLGTSLSTAVGGYLYDHWSAAWGTATSFNLLVAAGAAATATCWLLVPVLNRVVRGIENEE